MLLLLQAYLQVLDTVTQAKLRPCSMLCRKEADIRTHSSILAMLHCCLFNVVEQTVCSTAGVVIDGHIYLWCQSTTTPAWLQTVCSTTLYATSDPRFSRT
jgi:hypothetical protein